MTHASISAVAIAILLVTTPASATGRTRTTITKAEAEVIQSNGYQLVRPPLPTLAGDGTATTNQTVQQQGPSNTCNAGCIPEHVKLKYGKPLCCTEGHESLKCPGPAHYHCGVHALHFNQTAATATANAPPAEQ